MTDDLKQAARDLIELDAERIQGRVLAAVSFQFNANHAPAIAQAYLDQCEEIERLREDGGRTMTEPMTMTAEEARESILFAETFMEGDVGGYSHHAWIGMISKLLPFVRAYADMLERETERRSQTLDDLQLAGQVCDDEAAIRAAERERLAGAAEKGAADLQRHGRPKEADGLQWFADWIRSQKTGTG